MRPIGLLVAALSLFAVPARGFVLTSAELNGRLAHPRWASGALPVRFKMNNRPLELLPNFTRSSVLLPAVQAAAQMWGTSPILLSLEGESRIASSAMDRVNLISFADTPANRDATTNALAVTLQWTREQADDLQLYEADIILNPTTRFATDRSRSAIDLQSVLTHEFGHALGLEHSPIESATMFPSGSPGQFTPRDPDRDDLAALRSLYGRSVGPDAGAISGQVLTTGGEPVFGAHVTAVDEDGVVQAGALTDRACSYMIPALPPGAYQLYAEPLDGPMFPHDLVDDYFNDRKHPLQNVFRTTFFGGNEAPATVKVEAEQTYAIDPIRVDTRAPTVNPWVYKWTEDFRGLYPWVATIRPGRALYLLLWGTGLDKVPTTSFSTSSPEVSIDTGETERGEDYGVPFVQLTLHVAAGARPGARNLIMTTGSERAVMSGIIEVPRP